MDTQRLILAMIFFFSLFMLYEAWQRESRPPDAVPSAEKVAPDAKEATPPPPATTTPTPTTPLAPPTTAGSAAKADTAQASEIVRIETDVFHLDIDLVGASIVRAELTEHRSATDSERNFVLLERNPPERIYVAQTGFIG